jgi:hypothetical protein
MLTARQTCNIRHNAHRNAQINPEENPLREERYGKKSYYLWRNNLT